MSSQYILTIPGVIPNVCDIVYMPFTIYEFTINIYEEIWNTISSDTGFLEIDNTNNIGSFPIITLTIPNTYTNNPFLRVFNGDKTFDISLGTFISSTDSPVVIDSQNRIFTKNNIINLLSYFPVVNTNKLFNITFINNNITTAIPISIYYKTYDVNNSIILKFHNSISLQTIFKQIDLPKKYYNSPTRTKFTLSQSTQINIDRNIIAENFVDLSGNKTYHIEINGINESDNSTLSYILGNVSFNNTTDNFNDGQLVTDKITGSGILIC